MSKRWLKGSKPNNASWNLKSLSSAKTKKNDLILECHDDQEERFSECLSRNKSRRTNLGVSETTRSVLGNSTRSGPPQYGIQLQHSMKEKSCSYESRAERAYLICFYRLRLWWRAMGRKVSLIKVCVLDKSIALSRHRSAHPVTVSTKRRFRRVQTALCDCSRPVLAVIHALYG